MAWNSEKAKTNHYCPAYIDRATLEAAEKNEYIKISSKLLLDKATELMKIFAADKIDLTLKRQDGAEYRSKAVVSVKRATSYDKESGKENYLTRKDGTAIMSPSITIKTSADDSITLYAKEDISNGIVIQSMTLKTWINKKPVLYRIEDLKSGRINCSSVTQAVIRTILSKNIIQERTARSELEQLTIELNKLFGTISEKVSSNRPDEDGNFRTVNNIYAQYVNDDFGEKCVLRSHTDNIVVELGKTSDGKKYAKATNFDMPVNTPEGTKYESLYINNFDDLDNLENEAMKKAVAMYKEIAE